MGLFFKNKKTAPTNAPEDKPRVNSLGDPLDKLVDGNLPWGWATHYRDFTDKIDTEFSYFLHNWVDACDKSPRELYSALKSFVLHIDYVQRLCESKGECFSFWFHEILTGEGYVEKRKEELYYLETNLEDLQRSYETKQALLENIQDKVLVKLRENEGILQSDFRKLFPSEIYDDVGRELYFLEKQGLIIRIKSGRTYQLYTK